MILILAGALGCYGKLLCILFLPFKYLLVYNPLSQLFSSSSTIFLFRSLSILQIKESTIRECFIGNVEGFLQNPRLLTAFTLTETNHEINGIIEINVNC